MNALEQRAVDFMNRLQKAYYEERDLAATIGMMDRDVQWIGTGEGEECNGIEEARLFLENEWKEFKGSFTILNSRYGASALGEGLCALQGLVCVKENASDCDVMELPVRISAVCIERNGEIKLRQLHISLASSDQAAEEFFPRIFTKEQTEFLKNMLDEQTTKLKERSLDLEALTNNIPGGVICCDYTPELDLLQFSEGFLSMFGYTREEIMDRFHGRFAPMIYEKDLKKAWTDAKEQLERQNTKEIEYRVVCKDGSLMWVLDRGQLVERNNGKRVFYCILMDITENKKAREERRLSVERHQIILDQSTDIIFEWDIKNDDLFYSSNWEKKFGYKPIKERVSEDLLLRSHVHPKDVVLLDKIIREMKQGVVYSKTEIRIAKQDGNYLWCRVRATLQTDENGAPAKVVGVIIDIDQEKRYAKMMQERAERDVLTGLYNKGAVQAMVEKKLEELGKNARAAFMIIDVDNFKMINDVYGHLSGDAMLADVAGILQNMFREGDVVGRVGGDEFTVFLGDIQERENAGQRARDILSAFEGLLGAGSGRHHLSCSIGIAMAPEDGTDFYTLYKNADVALYNAKTEGKCTFSFYSPILPDFDEKEQVGRASYLGAAIDSNHSGRGMNQELAEYVFHTLYQTEDIEKAIPLILEIVGKKFDVSRAYIFENSEDGATCSNTFEWCDDGILPQIDVLQNIDYVQLDYFEENFNEDGIFYCKDVDKLSPKQQELLKGQGIKSMLQCAIRDDGKIKGFVGFDECSENRFWTKEQVNTLSLVAAVLSVFLLKERAHVRTEEVLRALETILDYQDSWIYVVEKDTHKILYANKRTKENVPGIGVGEKCCKVFFQTDKHCDNCPGGKLTQDDKKAEAEIFSEILDRKVMAKARSIPWVGGKEVFLMICDDVSQES